MEAGTTATMTTKLPILNPREYNLWLIRIEQYFLMTDYSFWEVIKNGNKVLKKTFGTVERIYEPTSVEEKLDRENEMKARGTLYREEVWRNKESKKVEKTLLKQQYENFAASSSETLDQTFDRLQKLISQLEIQGEVIEQEDISLKLTNNTSSTNEADNTAYEVNTTHTQGNTVNSTSVDNLSDDVICVFLASQPNSPQLAREDLEQIDLDDLEEMDLHWEMAMLTIKARRFIKRTSRNLDINGQKISFDRSKVECFNCQKHRPFERECRAPKNQENRGKEYGRKTVPVENPTKNALIAQDGIGGLDFEVDSSSKTCLKAYATLKEQYDSLSLDYKKSQFNLVSYEAGLQSVKERLVHYKKNEAVFDEKINILNLDVRLRDNALVEYTKKLEKAEKVRGYKAASLAVENFMNSSKMIENQENVKFISNKGYHAVPPPYTGNYIPPKPDLMFIDNMLKGNPQQKEYKEKEIIDSGCSRHMTGNKCYLTDYEDYDGGFFSFGDGKGRISRKGKIKTGSLDFDDVYFRKKLKYNLLKIKREFSVARIPQQNGVTKRKNRILIEASRTMLVDSKLPTTFWAEVVNTACYVLNRALVIKPHNKTPYELIRGRTPLIDFMKPFGCHAEKKKEPEQKYILIPICTTDPLISQGPKDSAVDARKKDTKVDES
nr:ribonuclease H-like domain-containing protein [Tanacetum cinerariifolium]